MDDQNKEVVEALETLLDYSPKLLKALKSISLELRGNRQPDTDEYVSTILKGMNWEIQIVNAAMPYLNEEEILIDKNKFNSVLTEFNAAFERKNDDELADQFESNILPLFEEFERAAKSKTA